MPTTISPFPEFNAESIAWVYSVLSQGIKKSDFKNKENPEELSQEAQKRLQKQRFSDLYVFAQVEMTGSIDRHTTI